MTRRQWWMAVSLALACVASTPLAAWAQSAIAGTVRDTSGAVMPGVTIEVASPALIEKVRTAVTDADGRYQVVDLRPGVYAVTFTLPGFNTVVRDGLELPANFTAQINADMRVGSLEESITVSGGTPVVDVQSAVQQVVLSRPVLDAVPTGRSVPTLGALMPGARLALPDVGGTSGMQNRDLTIHGSDGRDTTFQVDGMTLNGLEGDGSVQSYFNEMMFEEVSYQSSGISAEVSAGGVRANMIPKDGGNQFHGAMFLSGANRACRPTTATRRESKGLDGARRARQGVGLQRLRGRPDQARPAVVLRLLPRLGRLPVHRQQLLRLGPQGPELPGHDAERRPGRRRREPAQRRGAADRRSWARRTRSPATSIASASSAATRTRPAPAASSPARPPTSARPKQYYTAEAKWTARSAAAAVGSRLRHQQRELQPRAAARGRSARFPGATSRCNTLYGAYDGGVYYREPIRRFWMGVLSYVTGSHALKAGIQFQNGYFWRQRRETADLVQRYRNGVPDSVLVHNTPQDSRADMNVDAARLRPGLVDS